MSRPQETQTFNTASGENATNEATAQQAEQAQQTGVNNYQTALSQFAAKNPYVQGGQDQTATNAVTANSSDAASNSVQAQLQNQAQRTGQNPAAANATAATAAETNARNLSAQQAQDTTQRIGSEAGYNQTALQGAAAVPGMEGSIAGEAGGQANQELGTQEQAAQTPSFGEMLTSGLLQAGGAAAGAYAKCWIAATLYDGWDDPRVSLLRSWIFGPFAETFFGGILARAYERFGERFAAVIGCNRMLRRMTKVVFDQALVRAVKFGN